MWEEVSVRVSSGCSCQSEMSREGVAGGGGVGWWDGGDGGKHGLSDGDGECCVVLGAGAGGQQQFERHCCDDEMAH